MSQTLSRAVGQRRARELSFTAQIFTGAQAFEWGVANASFSADNFTRLNITKNINVQIESSELKDMTRERAKAVARAIELNLIIKKNREENKND